MHDEDVIFWVLIPESIPVSRAQTRQAGGGSVKNRSIGNLYCSSSSSTVVVPYKRLVVSQRWQSKDLEGSTGDRRLRPPLFFEVFSVFL